MVIVFDIGATNMRVARSDDGKNLSEPIIHKTPEHFKEGISLLTKSIRELAKRKPIGAIAGAISGTIDRATGTIISSPNLHGWQGHSVSEKLLSLSSHIFIENDAALGGLGEALRGAGRDHEIVAYFTISSGIGGARIVQEMIDVRRLGFEPGQQIIDKETLNSLESLVSGKALEKKYNKEPKLIEDHTVWKKATENLVIGIHNAIVHWSPDVVVLNGPMILKKPGIDFDYLKEYLKSIMIIFSDLPKLKLAELGDNAGLHGALEYIQHMNDGQGNVLY